MERLTERRHFKEHGHYMKCTEDCFLEDIDCGDCQRLDNLVDRLGAYEDTGLTPERCAELAKADKEGRLVVLPCRLGDTVFTIYQDCVMECSVEFVNMSKFAGGTVVLCRKGRYADQYGLPFSGFNKGAFATREEAEQALKEARGE